jgi:hypothetical protein
MFSRRTAEENFASCPPVCPLHRIIRKPSIRVRFIWKLNSSLCRKYSWFLHISHATSPMAAGSPCLALRPLSRSASAPCHSAAAAVPPMYFSGLHRSRWRRSVARPGRQTPPPFFCAAELLETETSPPSSAQLCTRVRGAAWGWCRAHPCVRPGQWHVCCKCRGSSSSWFRPVRDSSRYLFCSSFS